METYDSSATEGYGKKIIFVAIIAIMLGVLAVGGYYLTKKSGDNSSVVEVSPSPTTEMSADKNLDSDSDAIPDLVEKAIGANPEKMDTDGDSYNDLPEIKSGYSPLIAGASGKYTPENLQILKDKIKVADAGFYNREFGAPVVSSSPSPAVSLNPITAVKKCEYPEKIGEYSKRTAENTPLYDEKGGTKSLAQGLLVNYYIDNSDMITGIFFNLDKLNNKEKEIVSAIYLSKDGGESCSIGNIVGICVFKGDFSDKKDINVGDMLTLDFVWREGVTTKVSMTGLSALSLSPDGRNTGVTDIKQRIKENLIPFVAQFKDCIIE